LNYPKISVMNALRQQFRLLGLKVLLLVVFVSCDNGNFEFTQDQFTVTNETGHPLLVKAMDSETAALFDPAPFTVSDKNNPDIIDTGKLKSLSRNDIAGKLDANETLILHFYTTSPEFNNNSDPDITVGENELLLFYAFGMFFEPSDLEKNDGFINVNFN